MLNVKISDLFTVFFYVYCIYLKRVEMTNIKNNNFNKINIKISKSDYWDFSLTKDKGSIEHLDGSSLYDDLLISYINVNDPRCVSGNTLYSTIDYRWLNSFNNGLSLYNTGFNLIDNGFYNFDINNISSDDFSNIVTASTLTIPSGDTRLVLNLISGNTTDYCYPVSHVSDVNGDYIQLEGGFYQGFFKSNNDYSVLPDIIESEMSFEFILKPDFVTQPKEGTLNYKYPNNKGIFFYIGPRSENKFWYNYSNEDKNDYNISKTEQYSPFTGDSLFTNDGFSIYSQNSYDLKTDNKYLLFNRTETGINISNFDDSVEYHITGVTNENLNYYTYVNRTETGFTVNNISEISDLTKPYVIIDDIVNNNIAFRIKDDGSIGYRMINKNCSGDTSFIVNEEYSVGNIIKNNELTFINVRFLMNMYSECGGSNRTFKLLFYVNGKLVFVSSELPEINLRKLNDRDEKQETIPFNISFGGGSQGLCDMIGFNTGFSTQYLLPIEENFAGSLIGAIHQFKVYYGKMDYSKIKNNFTYQSNYIFNPNYIIPTVSFWLSGLTINYPETTYKREVGNVGTSLHSIIKINDSYYPITGYKLFCYPGSEPRVQFNGIFNIDQSGGTIPVYVHNDVDLALSGLTTIKYMIEVLDTYTNDPGVEKIQTIIFDNMIFYGADNIDINSGSDVRSLQNKLFNNETTSFILETGAMFKKFIIAVPSNRSLYSVQDQMTFMLDITHLFTKTDIEVPDAGGKLTNYSMYVMENAIPYSRNHNFIVTLN